MKFKRTLKISETCSFSNYGLEMFNINIDLNIRIYQAGNLNTFENPFVEFYNMKSDDIFSVSIGRKEEDIKLIYGSFNSLITKDEFQVLINQIKKYRLAILNVWFDPYISSSRIQTLIKKIDDGKRVNVVKKDYNYLYDGTDFEPSETGIKNIFIHVFTVYDCELVDNPVIVVSNDYRKVNHNNRFLVDVITQKIVDGKMKIKPEEFDEVVKWIKLNHDILIQIWKNSEIFDFYNFLKKI